MNGIVNGYSRIGDESSQKSILRSMDMRSFPEAPKRMQNEEAGERFGVILGRSASVSSSASSSSSSSSSFSIKRAFSMRRSSSVSERYCRIHDQYTPITSSPIGDHQTCKKKQRGAKILKACKRLLRL